jgi:hypothetical protein
VMRGWCLLVAGLVAGLAAYVSHPRITLSDLGPCMSNLMT